MEMEDTSSNNSTSEVRPVESEKRVKRPGAVEDGGGGGDRVGNGLIGGENSGLHGDIPDDGMPSKNNCDVYPPIVLGSAIQWNTLFERLPHGS